MAVNGIALGLGLLLSLGGLSWVASAQQISPIAAVIKTSNNCDAAYPDFCIPSPPPDLDCSDIEQKNFTVKEPDPHRFDRDKDGIGCESR